MLLGKLSVLASIALTVSPAPVPRPQDIGDIIGDLIGGIGGGSDGGPDFIGIIIDLIDMIKNIGSGGGVAVSTDGVELRTQAEPPVDVSDIIDLIGDIAQGNLDIPGIVQLIRNLIESGGQMEPVKPEELIGSLIGAGGDWAKLIADLIAGNDGSMPFSIPAAVQGADAILKMDLDDPQKVTNEMKQIKDLLISSAPVADNNEPVEDPKPAEPVAPPSDPSESPSLTPPANEDSESNVAPAMG